MSPNGRTNVRPFVFPATISTGLIRVSHAFRPLLGNDARGVQLGGSGDTADDLPTARARMGDRGLCERHVRFSNRPIGVKHFQAFHDGGFNVARGLVLLYGIGT
jgi:hypothetical protein